MDGFAFKKELLEDNYEVGEDIGSGHFAVVRRVTHKTTGHAFAAKFIRKRRGAGRKGAKMEDIHKEVSILRQLNHNNIISLHDVHETSLEVILVLELVTGGELFDYISEKDHLGEEEASSFIGQILQGLKHLHNKKIAHLDLKPENIMILNRNSQKIKLIDFGLAQKINDGDDIRALMGTAEFVAPEVVSYESLSLATDMWSIGVITYILLSGASPFLGETQQETYHNITAINFHFEPEYFSHTSDLAKDFIRKLFIKNPRKRATVEDCLNHPWIRPREQNEKLERKSAVINMDNFKAFMARKRWKQSMRVVSLCNRLSKSVLLRKSTDTLGSRNTLDEENRPRMWQVSEGGVPERDLVPPPPERDHMPPPPERDHMPPPERDHMQPPPERDHMPPPPERDHMPPPPERDHMPPPERDHMPPPPERDHMPPPPERDHMPPPPERDHMPPPPERDHMPPPERDHMPPPERDHMPPPERDHVPPPERDHMPPPPERDHVPPPERDHMPPPPERDHMPPPPEKDHVPPPQKECRD